MLTLLIPILMKKRISLLSIVLCLVVGCLVAGCNPKDPRGEEVRETSVPQQVPPPEEDDIFIVGSTPPAPEIEPEKYNVDLDVQPDMKKNKEYLMIVKVVLPQYETEVSEGMIRGSSVIYASNVNYVRVTPIAPGFEINPEQSKIIEFDPTGTDVQFKITPKVKGPRMISAEVELLQNADGSGDVKTKSSGQVSVVVKVDGIGILEEGLSEIFGVVWDKFMDFWPIFVGLVFAALLFVVRKYIKKKTGYGGGGESEAGEDAGSEEAGGGDDNLEEAESGQDE
jgi:hypothetical protein